MVSSVGSKITTMTSRFEAEKFTRKNNFGLWRMKMRAMLIQQGLAAALEVDDLVAKRKEQGDEKAQVKRAEMMAKVHSLVVLCLGDKVLREFAKEKTAAGILAKLESLYMTKSLANRLYMKQRLYSYKFLDEGSIIEQLEDFNKAIDDLENIDMSIADEDKAIMLLNALPKSYDQLKDAITYGRETTITLLEVQSALRAKELQNNGKKSHDSMAESLNVRKFKGKKFKKHHEDSKAGMTGQKETRSCHWCKKLGHLKKDCYGLKKKQAEAGIQGASTSDFIQENQTPEILNVMENDGGDA